MWRLTSRLSADLRGLGLLAALLSAACTHALVGAEYRGDVLLELSGTVEITDDATWPEGSLRVAVFWYAPGQGLVEEQSVQATTDFPARYTLRLYSPPPNSSLRPPPWGGAGQVAVGVPLLYQDSDGSGHWDPEREQVVGGSDQALLVYSTEPMDAWRLPPGAQVDSGFDTGWDSGGWEEEVFDPEAEGLEAVQLPAGFQLLAGYATLCEAEVSPFVAYEKDDVRVLVGEWWDALFLDCGFCPPPEEMPELCEAGERGELEAWEEECLAACD